MGREPSGDPFNSIVQLEREAGIPRNPFINAGAIVVSDVLLADYQPRETIGAILTFVRDNVLNDKRCIIIITHDPRIFEFANRIMNMEDGKLTNIEMVGGKPLRDLQA